MGEEGTLLSTMMGLLMEMLVPVVVVVVPVGVVGHLTVVRQYVVVVCCSGGGCCIQWCTARPTPRAFPRTPVWPPTADVLDPTTITITVTVTPGMIPREKGRTKRGSICETPRWCSLSSPRSSHGSSCAGLLGPATASLVCFWLWQADTG